MLVFVSVCACVVLFFPHMLLFCSISCYVLKQIAVRWFGLAGVRMRETVSVCRECFVFLCLCQNVSVYMCVSVCVG